jgi:hypothetical protein
LSALACIKRTASENHAALASESGGYATFEVRPPPPSGAPGPSYTIEVSAAGAVITVKESKPGRLPDFCPERHINFGGSFCLNWKAGDPLQVVDDASASVWWRKLLRYLRNQDVAEGLRRWPGKPEGRAHGEAAVFQAQAEAAAERLGPSFRDALRQGRFGTQRRHLFGEHRVRLFKDGKKIATVIEEARRAMTLRATCPCGEATPKSLPLRSCGDHASALADLTLAVDGWVSQERAFTAEIAKAGAVCCGTIDGCPLSKIKVAGLRKAA